MNIEDRMRTENQQTDLPEFEIGDTVNVGVRLVEDDKTGIRDFTGLVIARSGTGREATFMLRMMSGGVAEDRVFPVQSPNVASVSIVTQGPRATNWEALTKRTLAELESCDTQFRPTNFWGPGLRELLADLEGRGLPTFKSWPKASYWFYSKYGVGLSSALVDSAIEHMNSTTPNVNAPWIRGALGGTLEARRDFDAARLTWDQNRWPADLNGLGESLVGQPPQYFRFTGQSHGWTRPYINYLLCMAALSRHVSAPPRRFLEIGGGFGVLGEIVMARDEGAVYVNVDIPPLLTVCSYYLRTLFGNRVTIYDTTVAVAGKIPLSGSAVLPNHRLPDIEGPFDVFVNTYSFQEMEPDVVSGYVDLVAAKGVEYIVSLNSRLGKPKVSDGHRIGVIEPVTSGLIISLFEAHGYSLLATHDSPLLHSAGQLAILRRA